MEFEELIERFEQLKRDLSPTEKKLTAELSRVRQLILHRSRARVSFTGDPLKDLCIFRFGTAFRENYELLLRLREKLREAAGAFILIHDTSYSLLINVMQETDRCYIPFRVAALGMINPDPLDVGYEHDITGDRYYLKLKFHQGTYMRELEIREQGKLDKWLRVIPTFRGRAEGYTERSESLKLILPMRDYQSSEDYIRQMYITEKERTKSKKPYWRIASDRFDTANVSIGSDPVIEIFEDQEFPGRHDKVFALYIGNKEVAERLDLDVNKYNTVQRIYSLITSSQKRPGGRSLIF